MIWNRPSNLWLGALVALFNVAVFALSGMGIALTPESVAAVNIAFAAVIALIAGQAPTVNTNSHVNVKTGNGAPDKVVTFDAEGFASTHTRE